MKQVSAKHYYYIALYIITTQKQKYVPQLIVHVDIIRAECEFLQLMLLRTKISLPWATYIIISSVSGSETWPKQYINKQEKAVFFLYYKWNMAYILHEKSLQRALPSQLEQ